MTKEAAGELRLHELLAEHVAREVCRILKFQRACLCSPVMGKVLTPQRSRLI